MQQVQHRAGRREAGSAREVEVGLAPKLERIVSDLNGQDQPREVGSSRLPTEQSVTDNKYLEIFT